MKIQFYGVVGLLTTALSVLSLFHCCRKLISPVFLLARTLESGIIFLVDEKRFNDNQDFVDVGMDEIVELIRHAIVPFLYLKKKLVVINKHLLLCDKSL